ncbi:MAG: phosphoribosylamine--glycine ligase [Oscillospiraceae bacterium]|jgi:phosphoribosylamine--glycine ligase|nr:phosphoribosylamine--glycine ligase [Oscillospiraceae bacterium]
MKILIIGSGGREHAIGWKLKQNPDTELFFAPGNGGTTELGKNINISVENIKKLADFAKTNKINLTVVGPELPLTLGITDEFKKRKLRIFGPDKNGAKLEGSKALAKQFMQKYEIPTAKYDTATSIDEGMKIIEWYTYPLVIKADGIAAGKGVIICENKKEAENTLNEILSNNTFGAAGNTVIIEEFLTGNEVSLLCLTDGETILPMETASDYKRALDNDLGANTGGMGSISPSPYLLSKPSKSSAQIKEIVNKTLEGIQKEGYDYRGVIYIGLILTPDGPKVLEYNARFGDPETEAILPRLESDLVEIINAVVDKRLSSCKLKWNENKAVCVVMASHGYPDEYETGFEIEIPKTKSIVFHAGTRSKPSKPVVATQNKTITNGGRVLAVTALGTSYDEARETAYSDIKKIKFQGSTYRNDIGKDFGISSKN